MLNKVPEVTLYFWIIKVLCTTVGETAADYLNDTIGLGLSKTTLIMSAFLAVALVAQFRLRRYVPIVYWVAVVLISIVGTLITDNLVENYGVSLPTSTTIFAIALAATFAAWFASERTLSIHTIVTTQARRLLLVDGAVHLRARDRGRRPGRREAQRRLLELGAALRRCDRPRLPRPPHLQSQRDPLLLDRLRADPAPRSVARRRLLAVAP